MKRYPLILFFICRAALGIEEEELIHLWDSVSNLNQPTYEDYQKIQFYLNHGERPYLDSLRIGAPLVDANTRRRLNNILNFKLLGPDGELPIFEIHHLNPKEETKNRCILLFASFNGIYPQKARTILQELKDTNYSGDVVIRIGGFPNLKNGGLKICHVPYSFKVAFLQEAKEMGYTQVLWLDTCMHPITDLEKIFAQIKTKGYFYTYAGTLQDNSEKHLPEAAKELDIQLNQYNNITHIHSSLLGLNMENSLALQLLNGWFLETEKIYPNVTWFPEELGLSAVAWKLRLKSDGWFGTFVCGQNEIGWLLPSRPTLQFYCEDVR